MEPINNSLSYKAKKIDSLTDGELSRSKQRLEMHPISLGELMAQDFPESEWLVENIIPASSITVLSAAPGSYKTWLLLEIALRVAENKSLFGQFKVQQSGVLMIDEENNHQLLQQRLKLLKARAELPICFLCGNNFILNNSSVDKVIALCEKEKLSLITFDSLVRIHTSDENDASKMSAVFQLLRRFTNNGITVVVTHHNRKPGQFKGSPSSEMRGSSDILAAVDCHLSLKRVSKNNLLLTQSKSRFAKEIDSIELKTVSSDNELSFEYIGQITPPPDKRDVIQSDVVSLLKVTNSLSQKIIHEKLIESGATLNIRTLRKVLEEMQSSGVINKSQGQGNSLIYELKD